jgi:hypothetical protein
VTPTATVTSNPAINANAATKAVASRCFDVRRVLAYEERLMAAPGGPTAARLDSSLILKYEFNAA